MKAMAGARARACARLTSNQPEPMVPVVGKVHGAVLELLRRERSGHCLHRRFAVFSGGGRRS